MITEKSIKNLRSYKKGQSGNLSGRPKGIVNTKTRLLRLLQLTQKKRNPVTGEMEDFNIAEQMDMALIAKALKGDVLAYREILDRFEGKVTISLEQNITNRAVLNIDPLNAINDSTT